MSASPPVNELEWVRLKEDIGSEEVLVPEGGWQKLWRKSKENPLVPLGTLVTVGFLSKGLYSFRRGETHKSQMMMRGRVVAQGFTIVAMVLGVMYTSKAPK